jgi:phosphoribosylformylglycinamidine synthase
MIRETHKAPPQGTVVAYSDNASVIEGATIQRFYPDADRGYGQYKEELTHILTKVETHNHPTAISPFPGASTGSGGEIRDEGATGAAPSPRPASAAFSVSNLKIPGACSPGKQAYGKPERIASALDIMIEGPIGAAAFNNEFGRPNLTGYFRTYEQDVAGEVRGYHKPIMIAGGLGSIQAEQSFKDQTFPVGTKLIQLGGPGMLIGLGGGAASSMATGTNAADLDFASVQRGNPEIQRRAQEVIDRCWQMGKNNPILSVHDVGAGGVSNALPELAHSAGSARCSIARGADRRAGHVAGRNLVQRIAGTLRAGHCAEPPRRIPGHVRARALPVCRGRRSHRRRPADGDRRHFGNNPVDMEMDVLLGKPPRMTRDVTSTAGNLRALRRHRHRTEGCRLSRAALPAMADKTFLITIGDRRRRHDRPRPDGRPVAGAGGRRGGDHDGLSGLPRRSLRHGRAHAAGRARCAGLRPHGDRRGADQPRRGRHRRTRQGQALRQLDGRRRPPAGEDARCSTPSRPFPSSARRLACRFRSARIRCRCAPPGKMAGVKKAGRVAAVADRHRVCRGRRRARRRSGRNRLLLLDLGQNRLGGSALAQVYNATGSDAPDVDDPAKLKGLFDAVQS